MNIKGFIEQAKIHASIDYGTPASVKKGNLAADKMAEIAKQYGDANEVEELLSIIDHDIAGSWVAYTVVKLPSINSVQKQRCIDKIKLIAKGTDVHALGAEIWLKEHGYGLS